MDAATTRCAEEFLRRTLSPLAALLDDESVTEIMVNDPCAIWVQRSGRVERVPVALGAEALQAAVVLLGRLAGRGPGVPGSDPWVEARFEGLRVAACLPPLTPGGPALCVRRHRRQRLTLQQLAGGSRAQAIALAPLAQAVRDGQAILIAGSTDAGKTTLLNALCGEIPSAERVITIEDTPELAPDLPHHLALACDPASGASIRDLLRLALRLRPDRILLGEVRGPEAFDLIQAAMTGHRGMMATIHAVDPLAALARVESLALCAGVPWPPQAVREAVARAFDFVVVLESRAGVRGVRQVVRVCGADPDAGYRVRAVAGPPSPGAGPLQEDGAARRAGFASIECGGSDARY